MERSEAIFRLSGNDPYSDATNDQERLGVTLGTLLVTVKGSYSFQISKKKTFIYTNHLT